MIPALPSRRLLCQTMGGHRFWPIRQSPGESMCLRCGCREWAPKVRLWPVFKRASATALTFRVRELGR